MSASLYVIDDLPQTYSSLSGAKWITHTTMPASNYGGAAVKYGDNIYYFGGVTTGDALTTTVYKYDINAQSWSVAGTMPEGKKNFRAFEKNGKVWVEGGAPLLTHSMYEYDIQANSWTPKADMPYPVSNFGAWMIGKYIYTDWGKTFAQSEDNASYIFQIYDTENNSWDNQNLGLAGSAKYGTTSAAIGDYSITAGGYEIAYGTRSDEMFYNLRQDASTHSMIGYKKVYPGGNLTGISSAAVSGRGKNYFVFAGGSGDDGKATSQVWIYDLNNSTWLKGPDLAVPVAVASDMVPVIKDDSLFVVLMGGYTTGQVAGYTGATKLNQWLYLGQQDPAVTDPQIMDVVLNQGFKKGESTPVNLFVKNNSNVSYNFDVVCQITPGNYKVTATTGNLEPGQKAAASLNSFTPSEPGVYYLKAYVPGFVDTLTKVIYVAPNWTQVQYADYDKGYWFTETDYPNRIENGAAAYNPGNKSIYVIGGTVPVTTETGGISFERSAKVKKYNVDTHEWSDVADAPLATRYTKAVALNDKIYAIGDNADNNAQMMIYDVNSNSWSLGKEMPARTVMNALATYSDSLVYCFGGGNIDTYKKASTVQVYNINTKKWTQISDMPGVGVSDLAVSILDNVIMVAGGSDATNGNEGSTQLLMGRINENNPLDIAWVTDELPNSERWTNLSCGSYSSGSDKYLSLIHISEPTRPY
jgi:N-acetylneuraminic acid mutarotase